MRKIRALAAVGVLALLAAPMQSQQPPDAVDVKFIKYNELCDFVEKHKGKVILLDFWYFGCIPCKQSFFHNVEMDSALRSKGLVVISVATDLIDPGDEAKVKARALGFLESKKATFTNVILTDRDVLIPKLRLESYPCVYVFNREGKWTQFMGGNLKRDEKTHRHTEVEEYVRFCLDQSAKQN